MQRARADRACALQSSQHGLASGLDERQEVRIDLLLVGCHQAVGSTLNTFDVAFSTNFEDRIAVTLMGEGDVVRLAAVLIQPVAAAEVAAAVADVTVGAP